MSGGTQLAPNVARTASPVVIGNVAGAVASSSSSSPSAATIVDLPQQDCTSNQSTSDSGLGGSSDNCLSGATKIPITSTKIPPPSSSSPAASETTSLTKDTTTSVPPSSTSTTTTTNETKDAPALKSLLKKSTSLSGAKLHNRSVSFNQTVIVFCQEDPGAAASSPYDPPAGYQDDDDDESAVINKAISRDPSNLTDDQLIGLLENESFLESFKISCDDPSDDEFDPIYSNQGYLCGDAISDSDQEESSGLSDAKPIVATANLARPRPDPQQVGGGSSGTVKLVEPAEESRPMSQRSLPARVKVSMVDNSLIRSAKQSSIRSSASSSPCAEPPLASVGKQQATTNANARLDKVSPSMVTMAPKLDDQLIVRKEQQIEETLSIAQKLRDQPNNTNNTTRIPILNQTAQTQVHHHQAKKVPQLASSSSSSLAAQQKPPLATPSAPITLTQPASSQPACHVCRAIESNGGKPNNDMILIKAQQPPLSSSQLHPHDHQPQVRNQMPPAANNLIQSLDPSCVSCRESALHAAAAAAAANNPNAGNVGKMVHVSTTSARGQPDARPNFPPATTTTTARPVAAYQVVYVVDQNGNRVRALSLVRPPPNGMSPPVGQAHPNGSRVILSQPQNGLRFPNPSTIVRLPLQHLQQPPQQQRPQQLVRYVLPSNQAGQTGVAPVRYIVASQQQLNAIRQHTVYYVRQPLSSNNVRGANPNVSVSSFPGPQEIRRIDGIRAPSDSGEDPTFGFSNRPSVKVVTNTKNGN